MTKINTRNLEAVVQKIDNDIIENEDNYEKLIELVDTREAVVNAINNSRRKRWYDGVDINTLISSGVSLTSILLILNYEKTDIITTKAMSIFNKLVGK